MVMESVETVEPVGEAYEVPALVEVGSYSDLTAGFPAGDFGDGGTPPFTWAFE
jgi:hypothetical protein